MKKTLFILTLLFTNIALFAQDSEEKGGQTIYNNYVGIKAGVNYSGLYSTDLTNTEMIIGPNIGLFFESRQSEKFGILIEANYSKKGGTVKDTSDISLALDLNYLDVPIMASFYITPALSISAGIQPSFLLDNPDMTISGSGASVEGELEPLNYFPIYLGFVAGINYKITPSFNVDLKYNPVGRIYSGGSEQNTWVNAITLRLGYAIFKS